LIGHNSGLIAANGLLRYGESYRQLYDDDRRYDFPAPPVHAALGSVALWHLTPDRPPVQLLDFTLPPNPVQQYLPNFGPAEPIQYC
jgi:hypothetical protein